jgi:Fe-S cluster biogenesis protein NfuA
MAHQPEDAAFRKRVERLEELIRSTERWPDPQARARVREIVQTLLDVHGTGLQKILEHLAGTGAAGQAAIDALGADDLVGSLLVLHGLHPLDLGSRVRQGLDAVGPLLRSHDGGVELLGIRDGVVRLRLHGSCDGCPSSALTLKQAIEDAVYAKAPDVTAIAVEEEGPHLAGTGNGHARVSLPVVHGRAVSV